MQTRAGNRLTGDTRCNLKDGLETAASYLADKDPRSNLQYRIQITAIHSSNSEYDAVDAGREYYIILICATLGEPDEHNDDPWVRPNPQDPVIATNVKLQVTLTKKDTSHGPSSVEFLPTKPAHSDSIIISVMTLSPRWQMSKQAIPSIGTTVGMATLDGVPTAQVGRRSGCPVSFTKAPHSTWVQEANLMPQWTKTIDLMAARTSMLLRQVSSLLLAVGTPR
ncbi:fad nad -binding domain-containing protein [Moniliophthora roreri MCA 2997]|uniref:Fad nad-binding domain-containing protein n=1 Tax=Moniliophthora roreri (strain MCA 2997) TaxID=1381753 RepID=V2XT86_MONRO|nr:fad nad -binding domain-containing protein [Moniliophthora roreri MCA 2997]